ncbi:YybH family protein [Christiangramia salexigens]|uniref:DUF4440 domain-containing protein n=1 Tax=Christiangramia salexigens TaxID=1913577 RepID=A0A1L3J770_9FLAO|nr:nuclear transport factor 2 family protein [Christiangramia salexigens]APG60977.1 hypothetical protein LPB144_11395 [Christiangramia salexigens]
MKLFRLFTIISLLILISCADKEAEKEEKTTAQDVRKPSEVKKDWIDAWNTNNAEKLQQSTSDDAVLLMQGEAMGRDSIRSWYNESAPMMKDLRTEVKMMNYSDNIAYEGGTYVYNIKGDSLKTKYEGVYTIIWERTKDDWQVKLMSITGKTPDSTSMKEE